MKNIVQKTFSSYKKLLAGWSGADVGHTAARDWYVGLVLATALGGALVSFGMFRFFEVSQTVNARPEGAPTRSFPTDEVKILETKNRFDLRAAKFQAFSTKAPEAPDPGQKNTPRKSAEETATVSDDVSEQVLPTQ